jgi:hypothetical protein
MDKGIYQVTSDVFIRREPRIVEYQDTATKKPISNVVGKLTIGTMRAIYDITTDKENATWGRVSFFDSAGIAEWVCIKNINRTFMKFIEPLKDAGQSPVEKVYPTIAWVMAVDAYIRSHGLDIPDPFNKR